MNSILERFGWRGFTARANTGYFEQGKCWQDIKVDDHGRPSIQASLIRADGRERHTLTVMAVDGYDSNAREIPSGWKATYTYLAQGKLNYEMPDEDDIAYRVKLGELWQVVAGRGLTREAGPGWNIADSNVRIPNAIVDRLVSGDTEARLELDPIETTNGLYGFSWPSQGLGRQLRALERKHEVTRLEPRG